MGGHNVLTASVTFCYLFMQRNIYIYVCLIDVRELQTQLTIPYALYSNRMLCLQLRDVKKNARMDYLNSGFFAHQASE